MFDVFYCPNPDCQHEKALKKGQFCPVCGKEAQPFGFTAATSLLNSKKTRPKLIAGAENGTIPLLVSDKMTEEEIKKRIFEDMLNLASHEAGTGWMRLGTILSMNSTDQILGAGLKALIDQNKIIIRQNELLLRALKQQTVLPPPQ